MLRACRFGDTSSSAGIFSLDPLGALAREKKEEAGSLLQSLSGIGIKKERKKTPFSLLSIPAT